MSEITELDLGLNQNLNPVDTPPALAAAAIRAARRALSVVCANLPWLSPLAYAVDLKVDPRIPVAAVTASGRVLVNPDVFSKLSTADATFIIAHELMHLALDSFARQSDFDDHKIVNCAHDYIINDMLHRELGMQPPLGGLFQEGASAHSLEQLVIEMSKGIKNEALQFPMVNALLEAGVHVPMPTTGKDRSGNSPFRTTEILDMISVRLEKELFPGDTGDRLLQVEQTRKVAQTCLAMKSVFHISNSRLQGVSQGYHQQFAEAIRDQYNTPWQLALQRWLEAATPNQRTWARPSRRCGDRTDCVYPGRSREGWTLHMVLDTSGSMTGDLPEILGAIVQFCENAGVSDIHVLQCDTVVTVDEWIACEELEHYRIRGYGGSDMSPAMLHLSDDPEVTAIVVITDGYISYPEQELRFNVLWVVTGGHNQFRPPYGDVIKLERR